jgi:hypothetical protein
MDTGAVAEKAAVMADDDIHARIQALVDEEHSLAGRDDAAVRRRQLEEQLDQCWDLLRQRDARREFKQDPDDAAARSVKTVESYLQ